MLINNQLVVETLRMRVACHEIELMYSLEKPLEKESYQKLVRLRKSIDYYLNKFNQEDFQEYVILNKVIIEAHKTSEIERVRCFLNDVPYPSHQIKEIFDFFDNKENAEKADKRRQLAIENFEVLKNMLDTQR